MRRILLGIILLPAFAVVFAEAAETGLPPLRLGIYPLVDTSQAVRMFAPLAAYLQERTGRKVVVEVSASYAEHIVRTGSNGYDLAYLGPGGYIRMKAKYGSKPILACLETNGKPKFRGVIFARRDSPIASLSELRGLRFAFGDKSSTMGYLVPRHMLWKAGILIRDLGAYEFMANQEDVALAVLSGLSDAGAVREQVFEEYGPRGLKAIAWSVPLPEHLFVASSNLDRNTLHILREALLSVAQAPVGPGILRNFQRSATGLLPADDEDYAEYEKIVRDLDTLGER